MINSCRINFTVSCTRGNGAHRGTRVFELQNRRTHTHTHHSATSDKIWNKSLNHFSFSYTLKYGRHLSLHTIS